MPTHQMIIGTFVLALVCTLASAQTPTLSPAADNEQFVCYWTTETGWMSELQLRNNLVGQDLTVTPALRLADGAETPLAPITLKPQEVQAIDLGAAIAAANAPQLVGTYGSVVLRYHSTGYRNLYAAMMIHDVGHPIAFHIDAVGESQAMQDGSREGVWWQPKDTTSDYLILTNQSQNTIPLNLSLYDATGKEAKQNLTLGPGETTRYSVQKLVKAAGLTGTYGGIKVHAAAHAGSIDTLHVLFDETAGFSALLKMFDHDPNTKLADRDFAKTAVWTTRGPMLALSNPDPALAFPPGTVLRPQLFVRNTTGKSVSASLRFNWRTGSATGKGSQVPLQMNPYETRRIDVAALSLPANWASVTLTTTGLPDEVMAVAVSYDDTLRYGAQTPFSDQLSFKWEGGMWEYDAQHDSIMSAGNGGTKPTQAAFTIYYNQGTQRYDLEQMLQPDDQMWIDVGQLIREHVLDMNGKTLPDNLTSGSYEFRDLTDSNVGSLFEGKVIYDKTYGHVAYGCANCCGYYTPYLTFNPLGIPYGDGAPNGVDAIDNCGSFVNNVSSSFWDTWTTANTNIATVDYQGYHSAVAMGATTSSTWGNLPLAGLRFTCPLSMRNPQGNDNVKVGVTFSGTPIVPLGKPVPITATVKPSTNTTPITLTLSTTSGTGSATFANAQKTMTITTTTALTLVGVSASSVANNIQLSATVSGSVMAQTTFTVVATPGGAVPVNFRQIDSSDAGHGTLHFDYKWDSSSGNLADLQYCVVGENVTYPGIKNPFPFPSPPFPPDAYPNPSIANVFANQGSFSDDQMLTPSQTFVKPYGFSTFTATQYYRFACTYYDSGNFHNLMGPNLIVRMVSPNPNGSWKFTVTKSGSMATINPLP